MEIVEILVKGKVVDSCIKCQFVEDVPLFDEVWCRAMSARVDINNENDYTKSRHPRCPLKSRRQKK